MAEIFKTQSAGVKLFKAKSAKRFMAQKRDDYEDDDSEQESQQSYSDKFTISTSITIIVLAELFLYFLSVKTGALYGLKEMSFGLVAGIVMSLFLVWVRFIMSSNKHTALGIGLLGTGAVAYALTRRYQGTYTTIFLSIGVLLALFYIIFYFVKDSRK